MFLKQYLYAALVLAVGLAGYGLYHAGYRSAVGTFAADTLRIQNAAIADTRRKSEAAAARVAAIERAYQDVLSREAELRNELAALPDSGAAFSPDELRLLDRLRSPGIRDAGRVPGLVRGAPGAEKPTP